MFIKSSVFAAVLSVCFALEAHRPSKENPGHIDPVPYYRFEDLGENFPLIAQFLPPNPVIVDAGANTGEDARRLAKFWCNGHVYSFEPVAELYKTASLNTKEMPNISIYPLALGDICGERSIYLSKVPGSDRVSSSSSLFPPKDHLLYYDLRFEEMETIEMITLDRWTELHGIEKVDMLCLDMQGFELAAMKGAERILSKVAVIVIELEFSELYEGQPLYGEVKRWLEAQGFVLIGGTFGIPKDPLQHFADGLFVRRDLLMRVGKL